MLGGINQALYLAISNAITRHSRDVSDSLQRIASGEKLVRPSDDTVTYGVLTRLNSQLRGLTEASKNVNLVQGYTASAETALDTMQEIAAQLKELALQAADDALTTEERALIEEEAAELLDELSSIPLETSFNNQKLLNGTFGPHSVQIGADPESVMSFSFGDARATALGKLAIYSGAQNSVAAFGTSGSTALTLNGVSIGASVDDGLSTAGETGSALAVANAINEYSSETGVTAEALATTVTLYIDGFSGGYSGTLALGDLYINDAAILGSVDTVGELVSAINDQSDVTGVIAEVDGSGNVTLTAEDGRNINLVISNSTGNNAYQIFNVTANNATGLFSGSVTSTLSAGGNDYVTGAIQLYSSRQITIGGGATVSASLGISSGYKNLVDGTAAVNIDLSSEDDAKQSLKILDAVIDDISTLRAEIGAIHSRLDSRAAMLIDQQVSLDEAKTRIGGTDFALEIAKLTAAQLLQDASLSALTQANISRSTAARLLDILG